jgi:hypothetical protein
MARLDIVRLRFEGEDLVALLASPTRIRIVTFDRNGVQQSDETLHDIPAPVFDPRSIDVVRLPDGGRFVSLISDDTPWLMGFAPDGSSLGTETVIPNDELEPNLEQYIEPARAHNLFYFSGAHASGGAWAGNPRVFDGNSDVVDGEFEDWWRWSNRVDIESRNGWFTRGGVAKGDSSWHRMRAELDVVITDILARINITSATFPYAWWDARLGGHFVLNMSQDDVGFPIISNESLNGLSLHVGVYDDEQNFSLVALAFIPREFLRGAIYRLGIDHTTGFRAYLLDPALWTSSVQVNTPWTAIEPVGDGLVLVGGTEKRGLRTDGSERAPAPPTSSSVSQLRSWIKDGNDMVGACMPESNQIRVQTASPLFEIAPDWPDDDGVLDLPIGPNDGEFIFPLSFDVGPDLRLFVVDAGNVAVDDEGFIYVADVGNKRVQKFAP